ncbi:MAG: MiaB/RimO family radical SAM methylthiotransferase [Phycisphaerales bacterium]|nr:MiaB/RimO family radical SAM methylthiotransferase [Planctomycetota bacterium]MCH8509066.1 MiaB/RimO family radical SAM methylthiotransferase [Phycisphaerales bacterium]
MAPKRVYLETFGCQMNELDSELVAGQLASLGYSFTTDSDQADIVLYNTCSVRERAEQKVWSRLGALKAEKAGRPGLVVGVLGCMAERDGTDLMKRMPVVDLMCGPAELDKLPALLDNAVRTRASFLADGPASADLRSARVSALQGSASRRSSTLAAAGDDLEMLDLARAVSPTDDDAKRSAYVRITRGCNKFCTYCVVPHTRGAEIHRPPEHIIDECKKLADAGVIEITLLGQTVNHYRFEHGAAVVVDGVTQPQKGRTYKGSHHRDAFAGANTTTFADLLRRIHDEVPAIQRLRFVTSYPRDFGDDVLEVIRDHPRLCRYLHVPAQSGSDRILKMMNRGYTIAEYDEFVARARSILDKPEIGRPLMLSGDVIVGFPTETEEDHQATKDMLVRSRCKNQFIFKYSPRPGTVAYDRIPDDIPDAVKRRRNNELLALQSEISDSISREQIGRRFEVLVEGVSRAEMKKRGADVKPGSGMVGITVGGRDPAAAATLELPDTDETVQLSGRTDTDLIVFFEVPSAKAKRMLGSIVEVEITSADRLALTGRTA